MFRISCIVDDKKLANVLRMLASAGVLELTQQPLADATRTAEGVQRAGPADVQFKAWLGRRRMFTGAQLKEWLLSNGRSTSSAGYVIQALRAKRGKGEHNKYYVLPEEK